MKIKILLYKLLLLVLLITIINSSPPVYSIPYQNTLDLKDKISLQDIYDSIKNNLEKEYPHLEFTEEHFALIKSRLENSRNFNKRIKLLKDNTLFIVFIIFKESPKEEESDETQNYFELSVYIIKTNSNKYNGVMEVDLALEYVETKNINSIKIIFFLNKKKFIDIINEIDLYKKLKENILKNIADMNKEFFKVNVKVINQNIEILRQNISSLEELKLTFNEYLENELSKKSQKKLKEYIQIIIINISILIENHIKTIGLYEIKKSQTLKKSISENDIDSLSKRRKSQSPTSDIEHSLIDFQNVI